MKTFNDYIQAYKNQLETEDIQKAYKGLIIYVMNLKTHFTNKYYDDFYVGHFHQGYMDVTYFTFTPISLKNKKLKIGIGFNHKKMEFGIWLSGQNKQIQKKYWEIFKDSDLNKYYVPTSINKTPSIIEHTLLESPNFNNLEHLTNQIENKAMSFINDMIKILD